VELRRLAKLLEIDVIDREEYLKRYASKNTPRDGAREAS
jgi:hypothetical protein